MGKIDEKKQIKEERLLDTAFRLFTTQGVSKTSISDIAQKAGVAKGTFYLYFRDKYDLRDCLVAHKAEQAIRHALEFADYQELSDDADKIIAIVDNVLEQLRRDPMLLRFINKNLSWGVFRRTVDEGDSECFEKMQALLDVSRNDAEIVLYQIIELVSATCQNVILEERPMDLEHFKPYLFSSIRAILSGFKARLRSAAWP